jgi:ubiquinol-cytochrome c reductase cytochrome b subunit
MNKLGSGGAPGLGSLLTADPPAEQQALTESAHAQEQRAITALRERQDSDGNGSSPSDQH